MVDGKQFGLIIAYLIPGFLAMMGVAPLVPAVSDWLRPTEHTGLGLGPPTYVLMLAVALGLFASCVRWLVIDHLMVLLGVRKPVRDYAQFPQTLSAVDYLVEHHYNFYQFFSNSLVSIIWAYVLNRVNRTLPLLGPGTDLAVLIMCAILLLASRDCLRKYRTKLSTVLSSVADK